MPPLLLGLAVFAASHVTQARPRARRPAPAKPGPPPLSEEQALKGSLDIRLAYIVTGDKEVDDISKAGLEGLSEILRNRTSVEPADPVGLDLEKDEPRLYPLIYWPITSTPAHLSPRASAALDRYLRTGGILFIDTRDQQLSFDRQAGGNPDLKRLLGGIETPPLIAMPPDHVLTKSFYLLSDMPGRWAGGKLWIESGNGRVNDGVTTIIIGANDYAGAWAVDQRGRGLDAGIAGRRDAARDGLPLRRQPRDACADRQLQGRHGPYARHHAEAAAMNATSAVSVAFDPLLPGRCWSCWAPSAWCWCCSACAPARAACCGGWARRDRRAGRARQSRR